MMPLSYHPLTSHLTSQVLAAIAPEIAPRALPPAVMHVEVSPLPFYDDFKLYALTDVTMPPPNVLYVLHKPGDAHLMNWTNEPIYNVNMRAPLRLTPETTVEYAKFFFHFVRGQFGRFIIVEQPEDIVWLLGASEEEKKNATTQLMPLTYRGVDLNNLLTLRGTVLFKNALFRTDIKVAPGSMTVFDTELETPSYFSIGQMQLTHETLLLENLNVPIDPPPGRIGSGVLLPQKHE